MKWETYLLQNRKELAAFCSLLKEQNVKSYLEVGCKFGGSLWIVANSLPRGSHICAVDLPQGDKSFKNTQPILQDCVAELRRRGYRCSLIFGDSTDPEVVEQVYALGPFDAAFIDANHTLPYVQKDWENYGKICKLIGFHDIGFYRAEGLPPHKKPIEVPIFWNEIKKKHRHVEFKLDPQDNGIGVLWPS